MRDALAVLLDFGRADVPFVAVNSEVGVRVALAEAEALLVHTPLDVREAPPLAVAVMELVALCDASPLVDAVIELDTKPVDDGAECEAVVDTKPVDDGAECEAVDVSNVRLVAVAEKEAADSAEADGTGVVPTVAVDVCERVFDADGRLIEGTVVTVDVTVRTAETVLVTEVKGLSEVDGDPLGLGDALEDDDDDEVNDENGVAVEDREVTLEADEVFDGTLLAVLDDFEESDAVAVEQAVADRVRRAVTVDDVDGVAVSVEDIDDDALAVGVPDALSVLDELPVADEEGDEETVAVAVSIWEEPNVFVDRAELVDFAVEIAEAVLDDFAFDEADAVP